MTVSNKHGKELDFESIVQYMDDDLRERLHDELAPCAPQSLLLLKKFREKFFVEDIEGSL